MAPNSRSSSAAAASRPRAAAAGAGGPAARGEFNVGACPSTLRRALAKARTRRSEFSHAKAKAGATHVVPLGARRSAVWPGGGEKAPGKNGVPGRTLHVMASLNTKGAPRSGPEVISPRVSRVASFSARTTSAAACACATSGSPAGPCFMAMHAKMCSVDDSARTSTPSPRRERTSPTEAMTATPRVCSRVRRTPSKAWSWARASSGASGAQSSKELVAMRAICSTCSRRPSSVMAVRKKGTACSTAATRSS
mmetsp:Transcript_4764/g.13826  ORF Transcript_4764/g.13826 Transcript_4764/m.13826 type:complete len:252 (-) Transcript_4764:118-873(-)